MSEAIAFDTHRFVKNLTASGFTEAQAEALAGEQAHLLDSNLATRSGLEVEIEQFRSYIVKWVVGAMTAHAALIAGLVWYLFARMPGG